MDDLEMRTWASDWAAPETVVAIGADASDVRNEWRRRMRDDPQEMLDALPHCLGRVTPMHALGAAQLASIEMGIVCHIWPDPLNEVLCRGGRAEAR